MLLNRFTPKNHLKTFLDAPRAIKRQLTCLIQFTSGSSVVGRNGILAIPRNHLDMLVYLPCLKYHELHGDILSIEKEEMVNICGCILSNAER